MIAADSHHDPELLSILLQDGADGHAKDKNGQEAIDYAMDNPALQSTDALQQLIDATK
jgi:hypothetical protein